MASSLARLRAALPRARPRAAARVLLPGRWDAAVLGASRRAALNACRCQVHSDVKVAPTSDLKDGENSSKNWRIKMLYDGDCPLCMREVNMLRERNKSYGAIKFVDISSKDYSPEDNQGLGYETAMGRIHAIQSDGTIVTDVEVLHIPHQFPSNSAWSEENEDFHVFDKPSLSCSALPHHLRHRRVNSISC